MNFAASQNNKKEFNVAINDFMYIGKPCAFHETVDPNHRIGKFLRNRMSIIDLIPCYFKIDFAKLTYAFVPLDFSS